MNLKSNCGVKFYATGLEKGSVYGLVRLKAHERDLPAEEEGLDKEVH